MNIYIILVVVAACIAWTVTKEEIFRPLRAWIDARRDKLHSRFDDKPFTIWDDPVAMLFDRLAYGVTCDYCFGHWVMLALVLVVGPPPLVAAGFVGHVLTYFVLVAGTAVTTTLFSVVRQFNKLLTEVAKWHEQRNQLSYGVRSGYAEQKAA